MSKNAQRIPCHDVMKGILICLVILSHINLIIFCQARLPNETVRTLMIHQWWYVAFYMPAFFFVTGVCSNFQKPFLPFLRKNFLTILLPAFTFSLLFGTLPQWITTGDCTTAFAQLGENLVLFGGFYWFLVSLFCSKLIYWGLSRIDNAGIRWTILTGMMLTGFVGYNYDLIPNYWYVCQTLDLTFFIGIGQWFKERKSVSRWVYLCCTLLFLLLVAVFYHLDTSYPYVAADYHIKVWWKLLLHPLLATCGTLLVLGLSRWIDSNGILEFLGRGSLVIFMTHLCVLKGLISLLAPCLATAGTLVTLMLLTLLFVATLLICSALVWLFQQKYLRILLGKH